MGHFIASTKFETEFDGDVVTAYLKPLKQGDALKIFSDINQGDKSENSLVTAFSAVLTEYVESISGAVDQVGQPVSLPTILAYQYFAPLVLQMGSALLKASRVADPKEPSLPPDDISPAAAPATAR